MRVRIASPKNGVCNLNRIMVVDDDVKYAELLAEYISARMPKARIVLAHDGTECLRLFAARKTRPGIIVLDMMLPKQSGFLVMEKTKKGQHRDLPPGIIMITGNPGQRHKVYAESLGAHFYLQKPFKPERLVSCIGSLRALLVKKFEKDKRKAQQAVSQKPITRRKRRSTW